MSYKNVYLAEINIAQTIKPCTQSQRYTVFSIISFTDVIVNFPDAVYMAEDAAEKIGTHCANRKRAMSITSKIRNIK